MFNWISLGFSGNNDSFRNEKFMRGYRFLEAELQDMDRVLSGRYVFLPIVCFLIWSNLRIAVKLETLIKYARRSNQIISSMELDHVGWYNWYWVVFKVVQYTTAVCGSYLPKWSYNIPEMRTRPRFAIVFVITVPFWTLECDMLLTHLRYQSGSKLDNWYGLFYFYASFSK